MKLERIWVLPLLVTLVTVVVTGFTVGGLA